MLQQTPAARVVAFYERFVLEFPTIQELASAPLSAVLRAWNGLGYNRRAHNLHTTAALISTNGWPTSTNKLMELPGIGIYTARALSCFAFGRDEVPIDTNLRRVLSRWHGKALTGKTLQKIAEIDSDSSKMADWTQAVMDLGSSICTARAPSCQNCPVSRWCKGPGTYVPPRVQTRFEGSIRQLRGAIIRRLVTGDAKKHDLVKSSGFPSETVSLALQDLVQEGLVERGRDKYRLPD